jgi:hypothetical protein
MATVTYNAQSFAVDGRRLWIVGAAVSYARIPPDDWAKVIGRAREAGFNTIATECPWAIHEPRKGRYSFEDQADLRQFVELCGEAGMYVLLRAGPYVGSAYDGGGLPPWLGEIPDVAVREANEPFLERATKYLRKLVGEVADLQVTSGGPVILFQGEHGWNCSNQEQEAKYLGEIVRILRESGVAVPIINTNDLWADVDGTIDTWRGWEQMLANVRQLRTVQTDAPRLCGLDVAPWGVWGHAAEKTHKPELIVRHLAEVLAAGGQPIVGPFHGGTNFGFAGGLLSGENGAAVTTTAAPGALLGETGVRTRAFYELKRLTLFAQSFGQVLSDLDPGYQPITLDPAGGDAAATTGVGGMSIVPLRGGQGRVVFVFARGKARKATLLLDNGVRMPIDLGDQSVGWYVLDVDLYGHGKLDYANLCPIAIVDRTLVVLQGPEKAPVYLSVSGTPLQTKVPSGKKPALVKHKGISFVICNQAQAELVCHTDGVVYVGAAGMNDDGEPLPMPGWTVTCFEDGEMTSGPSAPATKRRTAAKASIDPWRVAPAVPQASGKSPRYASLDGPQPLAACGAATGYGWYRIQLKSSAARKRLCHLPEARDRLHLYLDGEFLGIIGEGPASEPGPFELKLPKGASTLVVLADNYGRFADGNEILEHKGLFGHLYEVKAMGTAKPKTVEAEPVSPFDLRGYIQGRVLDQLSDTTQLAWSFTHSRQTPIIVDVRDAVSSGTFVLNGTPLAYYAGATAGLRQRLVLDPKTTEPFKRGKNELRFAPDPHQDNPTRDITTHTKLYEAVEVVSKQAAWAFAKWQPPAESSYVPLVKTESKSLRGTPAWFKTVCRVREGAGPLWIDTAGLSKGQIYVNKKNLGRYFTARADGKAVGPQRKLYLPASWVHNDQPNELLIFDEHGFDPGKLAIVESEVGEHEVV